MIAGCLIFTGCGKTQSAKDQQTETSAQQAANKDKQTENKTQKSTNKVQQSDNKKVQSSESTNQTDNKSQQIINNDKQTADKKQESTNKTQQSATEKQNTEITSEPIKNKNPFFVNLPDQFVYSSGVGGWGTYLDIKDDGTFTGKYFDKDTSNKDDKKYPEGTVYICNFSGKFSHVKKIDNCTYTMKISSFKADEKTGEEYTEGDIRYIYAKPYGLENSDVFYVYLPDKKTSELDKDYFIWDRVAEKSKKLGHYSIYNPADKSVFVESAE